MSDYLERLAAARRLEKKASVIFRGQRMSRAERRRTSEIDREIADRNAWNSRAKTERAKNPNWEPDFHEVFPKRGAGVGGMRNQGIPSDFDPRDSVAKNAKILYQAAAVEDTPWSRLPKSLQERYMRQARAMKEQMLRNRRTKRGRYGAAFDGV